MEKTPIFTKTFDFITWLVERSNGFPRSQRFIVTRRLLDAALDFQELLIEANAFRGRKRMDQLNRADAELDKVRLYLRMAYRWKWITEDQYKFVSEKVAEIGKLLGGWKKQTRQSATGEVASAGAD